MEKQREERLGKKRKEKEETEYLSGTNIKGVIYTCGKYQKEKKGKKQMTI